MVKNFLLKSLQRLLLSAACHLHLWLGDLLHPLNYFPGDMYAKGIWRIFKTGKSGMSWHDTAVDMALWKENFSFTRNLGSNLPVVPLHLFQFNLVRLSLTHRSLSSCYLVFIIISHFKFGCSCQFYLDSVVR